MILSMSSATAANRIKIVLGTNILISAVLFGGKPREILQLVLVEVIKVYISPALVMELQEVIKRKFEYQTPKFDFFAKSHK